MAYDEGLAQRLRERFREMGAETEEKKMFGGLCFMVNRHMCCGVLSDRLMARVGPDQYKDALHEEYCSPMDFTGRPLKGMVYVSSEGLADDKQLQQWVQRCLDFIHTLPPK